MGRLEKVLQHHRGGFEMKRQGLKILIDNDLDKMFIETLKEYQKQDGTFCFKCKVTQGKPLLGWKKYYCPCLRDKIDEKFKDKEKEILVEEIKELIEEDLK